MLHKLLCTIACLYVSWGDPYIREMRVFPPTSKRDWFWPVSSATERNWTSRSREAVSLSFSISSHPVSFDNSKGILKQKRVFFFGRMTATVQPVATFKVGLGSFARCINVSPKNSCLNSILFTFLACPCRRWWNWKDDFCKTSSDRRIREEVCR